MITTKILVDAAKGHLILLLQLTKTFQAPLSSLESSCFCIVSDIVRVTHGFLLLHNHGRVTRKKKTRIEWVEMWNGYTNHEMIGIRSK